jgi:hypothetical protein
MTTLTFNNFTISATGPSTPVQQVFKTTRTGADRYSEPVNITAMHFDTSRRAIQVFCSDGKTRVCLIDRLSSVEVGRGLWKQLSEKGNNNEQVTFVAAGGFSPDRWFYTVC